MGGPSDLIPPKAAIRTTQAARKSVDGITVFEQQRFGGTERSAPSAESIVTNETVLIAFAFSRAVLAAIILGTILLTGVDTAGSDEALIALGVLMIAGLGLISSIRAFIRYFRRQSGRSDQASLLILLDAGLAIGVIAVIDAETSPLAWVALIAPVLETAVLFSMIPAAVVWVGLSLAFLAVRLTTGQADEPAVDTLIFAVQQVLAVLLVSGPAALLSDSTQQRIDKLADARRSADQIADRLRRIAQAASDMSQENSVESVLDSVSHSAVTVGFDHADVVIRHDDGSLTSHGSHSTGPFRLPPLKILAPSADNSSIATITEDDEEFGQLLHTHDLASGHATQISAADGTDRPAAVLRVWSKRRPATDQELRALTLLAGHAREIHHAAELLAEAKAHSDQLLHQVRHDGLTGLANRAYVLSTLEERIAGSQTTALFFIDLDGFKEINDTLGHRAGDAALVTIAGRLQQLLRVTSLAGRMGGDEFIVISPMTAFDTIEGLTQFGQAMLRAIAEPMVVDGSEAQVGASIGLAIHSQDVGADQLISLADHAMYEAKRAGGGLQIAPTSAEQLSQTRDAS